MDTTVLVIIGVVVILVFWFIRTLNSIKRLEVKIEEASSGIEVALEKRYDLLTNMLKTAKGYAKHEKETLVEAIQCRKGMSIEEMNEANTKMNAGFDKVFALAESYPELKADSVFVNLQVAVADAEEHLQAARRVYNSNVSTHNQKVVTFPNSIIAGIIRATKKEFFKAEESKRQNVSLDF